MRMNIQALTLHVGGYPQAAHLVRNEVGDKSDCCRPNHRNQHAFQLQPYLMRNGPKAFQARPTQRACIEHPCQQCADDAAHAMLQKNRPIHIASFGGRSEEHTSELQSLMRISYAVFCLKKTKKHSTSQHTL